MAEWFICIEMAIVDLTLVKSKLQVDVYISDRGTLRRGRSCSLYKN